MIEKKVGIGILGLGHVGKGTFDILEKNQAFISQEIYPYQIGLIGLADLDVNRETKSEKYDTFFTESADQIIEHPEIQIVIEAVGGEYPSYDFIKKALLKGKHVVTPNKEVVAKHGYELLDIARQNQVQFLFETSVGSAIPILGVISNILTSCPLEEIVGILNGTTNYILDLMFECQMSQEEALKKAQEIGYAEADPSKDIDGLDALYKIFILSSLGFRTRLRLDQINFCGIRDIAQEDIQLARQLGYRIKLVAIARKKEDIAGIRVQPMLMDMDHVLVDIHGANNGILLYGESYGELFFSGAGAGGIAGGSMIVSDIVRIINQPEYFEYDYLVQNPRELKVLNLDQEENAYYVRIQPQNGQISSHGVEKIFEQNGLSIDKNTEIVSAGDQKMIGVLTAPSLERKLKAALEKIKQDETGYKILNYLSVYRKMRDQYGRS
ncbi:MAG: homoserine dehydrogenase [Candidatus Atribacteria bacterium]|nr:homoserine dehydrogenase [Candidatus Atribacteria bacterium]